MRKLALPICILLLTATLLGCTKQTPSEVPPVSSEGASAASSGEADASSEAAGSSSAGSVKLAKTQDGIRAYNSMLKADAVLLLQVEESPADTKKVLLKTSLGEISLTLYPAEAPLAVENFLALARAGFYDGKAFYNARPGERIFAGATDALGYTGKSATGEPFADEFSVKLWHFTGALCMDNRMLADQNDSRFYIVQAAPLPEERVAELVEAEFPQKVVDRYKEVGGLPGADFRDTVFGQVTAGLDVVEQLAKGGTILSVTVAE